MKISIQIITLLSFFLSSCYNKAFYEYEIFNNTKNLITIEIETNNEKFQKYLTYHIKQGEKKRVFEHPPYDEYSKNDPLIPLKEKCKYFEKFSIKNQEGKKCKKDFFCKDCSEFRIFNGITGQQGIYILKLTASDFE